MIIFVVKLRHIEEKLLDIKLNRLIEIVRNVFSVLLSLLDTFGQEILDLAVNRAEVILRPCRNCGEKTGRESQGDLFLFHRCPLSIEAAGVYDRLCILVSAEDDKKI